VGIAGIRKLLEASPVISQPPIWQDALYARARLGKSAEFGSYQAFYSGLVSADSFPTPDLVVYMRVGFGNMLARIDNRARNNPDREVELKEKPAYWKKLWKFHEVWVRRNLGQMRIAVIDGDSFNFARFENEDVAKKALLHEFLNQARYHLVGPLGKEPRQSQNLIIPDLILNHRPYTLSFDITPGLSSEQKVLQRR
jgi:deoxyadenosine/deoxycytidine kinase